MYSLIFSAKAGQLFILRATKSVMHQSDSLLFSIVLTDLGLFFNKGIFHNNARSQRLLSGQWWRVFGIETPDQFSLESLYKI